MAANLGTAFVRVRGDLSHLNAQIISTLAPTKLNKLAKGAGVAIGAGLVAGGAGKGLFDLGKSFDEAFDTIRVGTGKTGASLKGLEDDFKNVLKTTPTDFASAGDAISQLNQRLGLTGEPLRDLSAQMLNLSRITKTDLSENIESVARAFEDWEVPVRRQTKALDGLFRLGQKSGASVSQLASQVQKFGSPLRILGFTLGEAAATFATFERAGVNTQTMVPGLKLAIANLTRPTSGLATQMDKLGISAGKPEEGLRKVFALLGDKSTLSNTEKIGLAMDVFGRRAGADMAEAIRQGRFEVDEMFKTFAGGGDSINEAAKQTEDFNESWIKLKNRIFVGLQPIATKFFNAISDGMEALATADFGAIGDKISKSLSLGKIDFGGTGDSISGSLDSLKSIVNSKLAGLIGAGVLGTLKKQVAGIGQVFRGMADVIAGSLKLIDDLLHLRFADAFKDLGQIVKGGVNVAVGALRLFTAPVREIAAQVGRALLRPLRSAWGSAKDVFQRGVSGALGVLRGMIGTAGDIGGRIGRALVTAFRARITLFRGAADEIVGILKRIPSRLGGIGSAILNALKRGLSGATIIPKIEVDPPGPGKFSFGPVKIPSFAKGGRLKERLALVGEEGFELAKLPGGKLAMLGQEGPEVRELPVGTRVYSHPETKQKLASLTQRVVQKLVSAAIRQPQPLVQRVVQESLGTKPDDGSQGPGLSGGLGRLTEARFVGHPGFARGGTVAKRLEDERDSTARRGQPLREAGGRGGKVPYTEDRKVRAAGVSAGITSRANKLDRLDLPYVWGGGHGNVARALKSGFDCSGAVSYVLGIPSRVSGQFGSWGKSGPGEVATYSNAKHVVMSIGSRLFGTGDDTGPHWLAGGPGPRFSSPFTTRHIGKAGAREGFDKPGEKAEEPKAKLRHKGKFNLGQMVTLAKRAHFPDPALAAAVGYAESRGNTAAHNKSAIEDSRGLWQINVKENANPQFKKWDLSDAYRNVKAAFKVSEGGKNWKPWTMFTNNQYKQYLNAKGAPLPKGKQAGTPTGSSYADYLEMKLLDAESDTPADPKDDLRWINRALRYWRGVRKRNKAAGNWQRASEAKREIVSLGEKRATIREGIEHPEIQSLDSGLAKIGTGPNAFNLAFMAQALEEIDLAKASASLTVPPDDDDSQGALKASLQDDIAAAAKLEGVWAGVKRVTDGFWAVPQKQPPADAANRIAWINQTIKREKAKKHKNWPRIHQLQDMLPALQGPSGGKYVVGTAAQKIEAGTNLASSRVELKSLTDEAGKAEAFGVGPVYDRLRAQSALAALTPDKEDDVVAARGLVSQYEGDLTAAQASGDNARIAEAAESLKGAQDELKSLLGDIATSKAQDQTNFLAGLKDLFKSFGSNVALIPKFAKGGWGKGLALVGEEGPEIVELPVGSRVRSHPESKRIAEKVGFPGFAGVKIPAFASGGIIERQAAIKDRQDEQVVTLDPRQLKLLIEQLKDAKKEVHVDARSEFKGVPYDRHQHAQGLKFEIEAALGGSI